MPILTTTQLGKVLPWWDNIGDFLGTNLLSTNYILIDLWSFIHFGFGVYLMKAITTKNNKLSNIFKSIDNKYLTLFMMLLAYEIFEVFLYGLDNILFRSETPIDALTDLWVGMLGGWVYLKFFK